VAFSAGSMSKLGEATWEMERQEAKGSDELGGCTDEVVRCGSPVGGGNPIWVGRVVTISTGHTLWRWWPRAKDRGASTSVGGRSLCRRGETTYAMGWLKWGPN
jgi:hypothetical protein